MSNINKIINNEKFMELENKIPKINNTLTSTSTTEILSANQGYILNDTFNHFQINLSNIGSIAVFNQINSFLNNLNNRVNNLKP